MQTNAFVIIATNRLSIINFYLCKISYFFFLSSRFPAFKTASLQISDPSVILVLNNSIQLFLQHEKLRPLSELSAFGDSIHRVTHSSVPRSQLVRHPPTSNIVRREHNLNARINLSILPDSLLCL